MEQNQKLWVVGKYKPFEDGHYSWELMGIFDNYLDAYNGCRNEYYFIGPMELNQLLPDELMEWKGAHYPKATPFHQCSLCNPGIPKGRI